MQPGGSGFYAAAQLRELDRAAMAGGIPGYVLMQRAAAAAWRELTRRWPRARRLAVICGPGNNGGDGFELARLARAAGWDVTVVAADAAGSRGEAAQALAAWRAAGGTVRPLTDGWPQADVVVDALFGIGLTRAPEGPVRDAVRRIQSARQAGAGVIALDVPSGLDADRGHAPGEAVRADLTVSFIAAKPGLHTGQGPDLAGDVVDDALDVPAGVFDGAQPLAERLGPRTLLAALPRRARTAHKGAHGHVLIVGGDRGMPGAALMAGRAALRAGAGLVSVATREAHAGAIAAAQPELMVHGVEEPSALRALLSRATVVAAGPGFGRHEWARGLWPELLRAAQPLVLDAEALHALADNPERRDSWILTPHPGEAARLLDSTSRDVQADRFAATRALRARYGGVIVLKGAGTLVLGERLGLCPHGNPGMGTGGMGDALTGLIAGLVAQGLQLETAARAGVVAHALAGDRAAAGGERGLLPTDVLAALRPLLNP